MYIESKVDFEKENPFLFLHPAFTFVVFTSKWWKIAFTFFLRFFSLLLVKPREREKKRIRCFRGDEEPERTKKK